MAYSATGKGVDAMYMTLCNNTISYRSGAKADMSFTEADKDAQTTAGVTN